MKSFIEEFKTFAVKGNVMDLAVAVVIGGAFGKIVSSLVTNIITPFMGVILGGIDFTNLSFTLRDESVTYGVFIQSVVDFIVIALVIFLVIKAINRFQTKEEAKPKSEKLVKPSKEVVLLEEIRDLLKK
jgi:large conductance mechanosensitive channel